MHPDFTDLFRNLTGHLPFPWQEQLFNKYFRRGLSPSDCNLPTGLGKTNVIAVWLIALAHGAELPRRLVYVVNRRTVVDQTTREAENLKAAVENGKLPRINQLAISTLRGRFADNGEWYANPSRPAVICGTVDMIGSRLLFEGYRIGFKSRPLHAGFLGQDALLVHDEAHLEPAFQQLIVSIESEQKRERAREPSCDVPWPSFRVMALSATARSDTQGMGGSQRKEPACAKTFKLTHEETNPPDQIPAPADDESPIHKVWRRLKAVKSLYLHPCDDERKHLADSVQRLAATPEHLASSRAIVVFLRFVEDVEKVAEALRKALRAQEQPEHLVTLTGTMRGLERDGLVSDCAGAR